MCDQEIHSYNIVCDRGACTASQNAPFEWCKTPPAAIWLVDICASQNDIFFSTERREMWMLVVKESQLKGPNGLNWWWKQQGNIGQAAGAEKKTAFNHNGLHTTEFKVQCYGKPALWLCERTNLNQCCGTRLKLITGRMWTCWVSQVKQVRRQAPLYWTK